MFPNSHAVRLCFWAPLSGLIFCLLTLSVIAEEKPLNTVAPDTVSTKTDTEIAADFLAWLQPAFTDQNLPGVAIAIVNRDAVIQLETWGVRRTGTTDPVQTDSLFRIASVSKTFAGTVATLVIQDSNSDWNSPIIDYLPGMTLGTGSASRDITLRNIVSHTTGLMPHAYSNMLDAGVAYPQITEKFPQIPTVCPPGRCYGYQNVVFSIISDYVEATTLESYADYLSRRVFEPLGMKTATLGPDAFENFSNAASPHRLVRGSWLETSNNPAYYSVAPAAGINASIEDMAIWARANLGGYPDVLSMEFLTLQHEPVVETPRGNYFNRWQGLEKAYYALGWRVFDYRGLRVIHHGGGLRGFRSEMVLVPERNLGLVVLLNAETTLANDIVPGFLDNLVD